MKKNLWMLGVAVAALTSCTQSEVLDIAESNQIRFEEFVEKNSRLADNQYDLADATLTNYWVYGYSVLSTGTGTQADPYVYTFTDNLTPVFNGMEMSNTSGSWEYEKKDSWKTNHMYRFAAYSNGNKKLTGVTYNPKDDKLTIPTYSVIDNSDITETNKPLDLVASIAGDRHSSTNDQPVSFTFRHLLSKITLHFTNNSNSADLHFQDITIEDIYKTGYCECTYATTTAQGFPRNVTWSAFQNKENFVYPNIVVPFVGGVKNSDEVTLYVIPQSNSAKKLKMTMIEKINNEVYNTTPLEFVLTANTYHTMTSGDMVAASWCPGYHYRYLITIGTTFDQIEFQATVSDWDKDVDGNGNPGENADNIVPTPAS